MSTRRIGVLTASLPGISRRTAATLLLAGATLAGCARTLMDTPDAFVSSSDDPFSEVEPPFRSSSVDVLYATDRVPTLDADGRTRYGYGRRAELAFGNCRVEFGDGVSWETLVAESRTQQRRTPLPIRVGPPAEMGTLSAAAPFGAELDAASGCRDGAAPDAAARLLQDEIRRRLANTAHKEAFIFIHGASAKFNSPVATIAELWHFLGRRGIPIAYTYPSGHPGLLFYFYDRESGEYTVSHLKQFIETLAACPELERIHLIGHSRGTDVLVTAMRELHIKYCAAGADTASVLKIANVVLIAPDLDVDVVRARVSEERVGAAARRATLYRCSTDRALDAADWLFKSVARLGQLELSTLSEREREMLRRVTSIQIIDARVRSGFLNHKYAFNHPAVSSDLVRLLACNCDAGTAERPLKREDGAFWVLDEGYLSPSR